MTSARSSVVDRWFFGQILVSKILKKWIPRVPPFRVTEGHQNRHGLIVICDFLLVKKRSVATRGYLVTRLRAGVNYVTYVSVAFGQVTVSSFRRR